MSNEELIHGLKTTIVKQVDLKHQEHRSALINSKYMIDAWKMLYKVSIRSSKNKDAIRENLNDTIWDYVNETNLHILSESSIFNIYSYIGKYTNKKGIVSAAHFTKYNKYLGSVTKLGDKPISYKGWFSIKGYRNKIDIDFDKLINLVSINDEYPLQNIFIIKNDEEIEIELPKKIKVKKNIKKIELDISDDDVIVIN